MRGNRPNVVYIFADEWRAQATGYAGDRNCETPALDELALQSLSFTNAVSGCPVCCPARASILTGLYPLSHGVFINDVELDPHLPSIATLFGQSGYETAYIGKWHVYGSPDGHYGRRHSFVPRDHQLGFDYWKAFECSHDYNDSHYFFNEDPTLCRWEGYDAFAQADDAANFIRSRADGDDPFLLMLSWGPPHFPLHTAPPEYRERYENREIDLRPNVPTHLKEKAQEELRGYYAHIAALDDALATVLTALREAELEENTILVVTSDHGDMRQSQGLDTKLFPWDESVRVPFLLRWPKSLGTKKQDIGIPIDTPDHLPTLLGLAGIEIPGSLEGRDWSAVIRGDEQPTGEEAALLMMAAEFTELRSNGMSAYRGLRTNRYTYVKTRSGPWLLYDNHNDPYQMQNLLTPETRPATVTHETVVAIQHRLEEQLQQRLEHLHDTFEEGHTLLRRADLDHYTEVHMPMVRQWHDPWTSKSMADN